jgi:hypothetical protein
MTSASLERVLIYSVVPLSKAASILLSCVWAGFGMVIGCIEHLQIVTTSNYSTIANSHATASTKSSVCSILTGCHLVTASKAVASSASVFRSLLAGDCLTTKLSLSLSLMLHPVSRPVSLGIKHPPGAYDQIFFFSFGIRNTSDSYVLHSVGRPL